MATILLRCPGRTKERGGATRDALATHHGRGIWWAISVETPRPKNVVVLLPRGSDRSSLYSNLLQSFRPPAHQLVPLIMACMTPHSNNGDRTPPASSREALSDRRRLRISGCLCTFFLRGSSWSTRRPTRCDGTDIHSVQSMTSGDARTLLRSLRPPRRQKSHASAGDLRGENAAGEPTDGYLAFPVELYPDFRVASPARYDDSRLPSAN
jgi:hypothetical protein